MPIKVNSGKARTLAYLAGNVAGSIAGRACRPKFTRGPKVINIDVGAHLAIDASDMGAIYFAATTARIAAIH